MNRKLVRSWALYDWANSAFATTIMAAVLPIFYQQVAASTLPDQQATSYWGYSQSIAVLIVAILAPILGAISDYSAAKKKFLRFFAYMGMIASVLLAFVDSGEYLFASFLLIIGTIGFSGANVFYDAFLPEISKGTDMDRVSSRGFAFGYIGGGLLLAINLLMIQKYEWFGFSSTEMGTKISFVTVGIWWFVFSIPLFKNVKEEKREGQVERTKSYARIGFSRVAHTFREINQYKQLLIFLLAFWLYNDGISTIIKMATIYGSEIGIGSSHLIAALLITQFVGIPCTFFFGWLATKITAKRALTVTLVVYIGIVILGYFMSSAAHFYALAICVGVVQGGAQSLSRSIFGRLVPDDRHAEFFGFYGISAKFSAIIGPALFGFVGAITGSSKLGIFSLVIFFVVGLILLQKVDISKGMEEARQNTIQKDKVDVHV
ncbi:MULTISPECIES: MFS transporter [Pontibacillus]|uniref:MFS transporter n=1 Tax=Pontibacillus chungwhensis TaxID=265426 RepID=A0ABY8V4X2_9BACI|nr:MULTISPECIES: MFS transporter [Pontibacillus]MCD5324932.1 MFS transporter [Pontibacillus sp. HN14]WIF98891.1 MFS transporter [Pontibacillus chungwhensis]